MKNGGKVNRSFYQVARVRQFIADHSETTYSPRVWEKGNDMPAIRTKTGQFAKGNSGNPSGRPKRSEVEKETLSAIYNLAPKAIEVLEKIMNDDAAPANIRVKCAEMVINRICGTPMDIARIENNEESFRFVL